MKRYAAIFVALLFAACARDAAGERRISTRSGYEDWSELGIDWTTVYYPLPSADDFEPTIYSWLAKVDSGTTRETQIGAAWLLGTMGCTTMTDSRANLPKLLGSMQSAYGRASIPGVRRDMRAAIRFLESQINRRSSLSAEPGGPANAGQPLSPGSTSTPPVAGPRR